MCCRWGLLAIHSLRACTPSCKVGWSDLLLFSIFENEHMAAYQLYFSEFNFKKSANFAARAAHAR